MMMVGTAERIDGCYTTVSRHPARITGYPAVTPWFLYHSTRFNSFCFLSLYYSFPWIWHICDVLFISVTILENAKVLREEHEEEQAQADRPEQG